MSQAETFQQRLLRMKEYEQGIRNRKNFVKNPYLEGYFKNGYERVQQFKNAGFVDQVIMYAEAALAERRFENIKGVTIDPNVKDRAEQLMLALDLSRYFFDYTNEDWVHNCLKMVYTWMFHNDTENEKPKFASTRTQTELYLVLVTGLATQRNMITPEGNTFLDMRFTQLTSDIQAAFEESTSPEKGQLYHDGVIDEDFAFKLVTGKFGTQPLHSGLELKVRQAAKGDQPYPYKVPSFENYRAFLARTEELLLKFIAECYHNARFLLGRTKPRSFEFFDPESEQPDKANN